MNNKQTKTKKEMMAYIQFEGYFIHSNFSTSTSTAQVQVKTKNCYK